jgi:transposase
MLSNPVLKGLRPHLELHAEVWRVSHQNVQRLDAELEEGLGPFHEEEARLETMPGVGRIVAATFLAVMGTPERFPDAKHAASYIGLVPATYDSGERECHGRITKHGSAELRSMLCEAGHHASNPRHPLYPYYARIAAKSGYKKAVTAVAHRMARILYQMWRHQEGFDLGKLAVEYREHVVQKKRFYQFKNPDNAHGTNSPQAN